VNYELSLALLNRFHNARILVIGDVILDRYVYGAANRISPEAPIPVFAIERSVDMPGGAANVARNVVALGGRCSLMGVVGNDLAAEGIRRPLLEQGVNAILVTDPLRPTSLKTRFVAEGQQMLRADQESSEAVSSEISEQLLTQFDLAVRDADAVVLSDYAKGVLRSDVVAELITRSRREGKTVLVDPKAKDLARYRGATILTPNRLELEAASGYPCLTDSFIEQAAFQLINDGICDSLVVTRGGSGMSVISQREGPSHLPTQARQVFDVSGAGDTVMAALALGMASGGGLKEAAELANLAAGIVVGKSGTATVTSAEILGSIPPFGRHADPSKVYSVESVLPLVRDWRARGLRIAFTNGCFDLLHPGHISLLEQARRSADRLIVGLNTDSSVRRLKGPTRPVQGEIARAVVLAAIKAVDAVVLFEEDTPLALIRQLRPNVLVKGSDYQIEEVVGAEDVTSWGGRVLLAQIFSGHSTTTMVNRMRGAQIAG
jgi:D-beta-D-heptose 7-phosphate kinase/D-beta-D-heptose 1-phosphate adenosyltransferase